MKKSYPIHLNPKHKGALHRWLGEKQGEPLTAHQLMMAKGSDNPHVVKMATFALNAKHWHH
jgi:hypothetical protein